MSSTLNGAEKASQSRVLIPIHNLHLKVSLIAVCNELLTYKSSFNISSLILHLGNNNCAIFNNLVSLFLDSNPIQMKLKVFYHFQDQDEEEEECASRLAPHDSKKYLRECLIVHQSILKLNSQSMSMVIVNACCGAFSWDNRNMKNPLLSRPFSKSEVNYSNWLRLQVFLVRLITG